MRGADKDSRLGADELMGDEPNSRRRVKTSSPPSDIYLDIQTRQKPSSCAHFKAVSSCARWADQNYHCEPAVRVADRPSKQNYGCRLPDAGFIQSHVLACPQPFPVGKQNSGAGVQLLTAAGFTGQKIFQVTSLNGVPPRRPKWSRNFSHGKRKLFPDVATAWRIHFRHVGRFHPAK